MSDSHSLNLFVVLCRTFVTVSAATKRNIKNHGLSLSEFETLDLLYHKGEQTIQEIGKEILLTSGSMTYVVNQLVKKELVVRKACALDRRMTYVEISESGRALMDRIIPQYQSHIAQLFSSLTTEQMIDLTEKMKQISKPIV